MITDQAGEYPEPQPTDSEFAMLLAYLERQRATFAWKTTGLDAAQLRATLAPSRMTLGGMLKHMARFENDMTFESLLGGDQVAPWNGIDWDADREWDWRTAAAEQPDLLHGRWQDAVRRSREVMERITGGDVTPEATAGIRYVLVNMIEEYARHNGHADLLRESIDGLIGHDPPSRDQDDEG